MNSLNFNIMPTVTHRCGRLFLLLVCVILVGCGGEEGYAPQEGDLVFVVSGESEFSRAISESTAGCDSVYIDGNSLNVSYVHVGIVDVESDGAVFVVEASDKVGVCLTPWDEFLEAAPQIDDRPGVTVMRLTCEFDAEACVERAKGFVGQPYDWYYLPDNGRMYCSELVWEAYQHEDGGRIFTAAPMSFRDVDGTMPEFWTRLYATLGEPVPEGLPGTNPNDLSRDPALAEIYCYFR